MQSGDLLRQLVELAREAGLRVRPISGRSGAEGEPPAASGVCRIGDERWVVLSEADSVEQRIDVLAGAIREHAPQALEDRYLAPALRERLESDDAPLDPSGGRA